MRGRTRVVIPKRAALCRLLKIGANHVAEVVAELDAAAIVQVKALDEGWELLVFPDFGGWRCKWLYMREELGDFLTALERAPGQAQGELIEPEPCLAKAPILGTPCASRASVNCEASIEQLNGEQLSPTLIPTVKERRLQLSAAQEHEAMNRLRSFVGEADVQQWGGDWRKNWLRADPEKFLAALDTLIAEEKAGMFTARKSKGAALKDLIRRWA
jgi:hypothetical protein